MASYRFAALFTLMICVSCVGPSGRPPAGGLPAWRAPSTAVTLRIVVAEGRDARKPSVLAALGRKYRGRLERIVEKGATVQIVKIEGPSIIVAPVGRS